MRISWAGLILGVSLAWGWAEEPVSRIGFGSCYKPEKSSPLWRAVEDFNPQVWLWLGDNVYADVIDGKLIFENLPQDAFQKAYAALGRSEGLAALKNLPAGHMMATWDDHDYGLNDAGKFWERKENAKQEFAAFWQQPVRGDGVYFSREFGPEGRRIRVILLDTRYNRDDPATDGDILGEAQWSWLEEEYLRPGAALVLIGSSIQVLPESHRFEKWSNFPKAKKRLLEMLDAHGDKKLIFLSGDRHHAEILSLSMGKGRQVFEVTSSGLTEGYDPRWTTGWAAEKGATPWRYRQAGEPRRTMPPFFGDNFGTLEIIWGPPQPQIRAAIRREDGSKARQIYF